MIRRDLSNFSKSVTLISKGVQYRWEKPQSAEKYIICETHTLICEFQLLCGVHSNRDLCGIC